MSTTQCRFYANRYPEVDDLVMVNVKQIQEMGAYVKLLEYENIEGMILLSELSRRRMRSVQKHIRVGRNEVVVVLRVDTEKGYIDLSKRRVSPEDVAACEEKFNKSKIVNSIIRHVAEKHNIPMETIYEAIGWPLYEKYPHAYDGFKLAVTDPDAVFGNLNTNINPQIIPDLISQIRHRLTPQAVKIRADIEVTCFKEEGIDAIKLALKEADKHNTDEIEIKKKLVAPPLYVLHTTTLHKAKAIECLQAAIASISEMIESKGGHCIVKMNPRAISETDELELQNLMKRVEQENAEISGDEEDDDEEDEDGN